MVLRIYNFLTRKKEVFKPLKKGQAGLYTCGPTVYSYAHIGNLRTYIFEDILRRTLEYAGYKVKHVMNITDVEDKIIKNAREAGKNIFDFTGPYEAAFYNDLKKINITPAWKYPKATDHVKEMTGIIKALIKNKLAYRSDESVYFDVSKFKKYGKLSRLRKSDFPGKSDFHRTDSDEYEKGSAEDFVLWKAKKEGEPSWPSPWGEGRPGWHIECSAMSMKYLGKSFDIHAGGIDLLFPHHENEIAQSEGATKKRFVKYFLEGEHLLADGKKMSKSLGNVFTLRDLEEKGFNPLAFRYLMLGAHYRAQLNFTWESLKAAQNSLERLREFVLRIKNKSVEPKASRRGGTKFAAKVKKAFVDDLDTPKALAQVWGVVNEYNKNNKKYDTGGVLQLLLEFDRVLGLGLADVREPEKPSDEVLKTLKERETARKSHDFVSADILRQKIYDLGWEINDTPEGPRLKAMN
ncbi:cysteine--tRNA ligase [Candidatus Giovannonibacteria bacterium RIFCSPHIGHO2_01_FULL_45_33]|uniref:Cysteine--tRNA ligase n=1 Tax=Candidatus Giovannonibacteria bacterium RIFCSPLOWO2_01_FULL_45_34 TaxID=1798351 RepID=A0A1F5X091_9BACT|nr:MAG: cysteine--tRNA ligase [Candidatus Giovannonibacteria bacterium RIFCSPHIGHO2_01_FULL_45_33]OGF70274.1 MAG: cysteine--tRNA ligase [Candidatus Giovannonibacteria bacterium RIFCSPHIGHO2_02_FULL_44_11]OGF81316.1 MAG: cysteine--tRNA ligase [Candidatus Giovannonibacteria bacterium RIFCSPLOWO2_01_FULL_45_34]